MPNDPIEQVHQDAEAAANAIEDAVSEHFEREPLSEIICRHEPPVITVELLGRFAVPIVYRDNVRQRVPHEVDAGAVEQPGSGSRLSGRSMRRS